MRDRQQHGQSLAELAVSSVVLLLILTGLVDLARVSYFAVGLRNAARESARLGAWFEPGSEQNRYLDDADLSASVARSLAGVGLALPSSSLRPGCPGSSANGYNPPYDNSVLPPPGVLNQPWIYICYDTGTGVGGMGTYSTAPPPPGDVSMTGKDLEVVVVMRAGLVTGFLPGPTGNGIPMVGNAHMRIQGGP